VKDEDKSKSQLIHEIATLRGELEELKERTQRYLRIEAEHTHSENFYRTLFENSGTATIVIEEDTTISMMNSDFANFTGYAREDIINNT
jgi:PAS domain-containing protein